METNETDFNKNSPGFKALIKLLAGIPANSEDHAPANDAASRLVPLIFGDKWQRPSEHQKELLINASAERLWFNYNALRTSGEDDADEAARKVLESEISFLASNLRYSR